MPLDPAVQLILDRAATQPPRHTIPLQTLRDSLAGQIQQGPPVARVVDEAVPTPEGSLPIRLYYPTASTDLPIVLFFHGGAFCLGSVAHADAACRMLCLGAGAIVASLEYRLAPEFPFPAATHDCSTALDWLADNARRLGGDRDRIAVAGESAGGNLAAVTAIKARDRGGPRLCGQLLINPATDAPDAGHASMTLFAEGYNLTREQCDHFYALYVRPEDRHNPQAAVLRTPVPDGLPPALILSAEYDPLRDEGEAYGERLRQAGVPVTVTRVEGVIHGFFAMPIAPSDQARAQAGAWLRHHFAQEKNA
jgi:acetyl esterase